MSIFNSFLGGGATALKKKTPATISANAITFSMGSEPSEYVLLALPSVSMSITSAAKLGAIIYTNNREKTYEFVKPYGTQYTNVVNSTSGSFSSGTFTISSPTISFDVDVEYVLYYR